jgi:2-dehydro-3-deoxygluconokinase
MKKIVTFGEVMGRLCPSNNLRFAQTMPGNLELTFGGAESNVASSIAILGGKTKFITALPKNAIAEACISFLKGVNVDTEKIIRSDEGRLGLYFLETGANQRPSNVIYDRENSSVALTNANSYDWDSIFSDAKWFHVSGITPAISKKAAEATLAAVKSAQENGVTVSCDLNFRKKLWKWNSSLQPRELAEKTMREILPYVDVVIANEEDASDILSITAKGSDISSGKLNIDRYPDVAKKIISQFNNVSKVAITLRESVSATHNNWGAMFYDSTTQEALFAPMRNEQYQSYKIKNIVDRVGGGDSFAAGLIFALTTPELCDTKNAISFAVAASCLAHSISGDVNYSTRQEVESLMGGSASGRVNR